MKKLVAFLVLLSAPALASAPQINQPAPAFTAKAADGSSVSLADYAGKTVVLEWTNHGCPFVKKFYGAGKMQALQKTATDEGAIWLRVISSAEGKQGNLSAEEAIAKAVQQHAAATHTLLDATGALGKLYGAKTTPHLFVINEKGVLIYKGAIDSIPSPNADDIKVATNYVSAALAAIKAGKLPSVQETKSYGCGVKY